MKNRLPLLDYFAPSLSRLRPIFAHGIFSSAYNVLTKRKTEDRANRSKGHLPVFCNFFWGAKSGDGTRDEDVCPSAAVGGGVGGERAWTDGATNQSRGERLNPD